MVTPWFAVALMMYMLFTPLSCERWLGVWCRKALISYPDVKLMIYVGHNLIFMSQLRLCPWLRKVLC